jgi:hypothetical protein
MTIILLLPLLILLNEQDQVPCNTFILFFLDRFRPLGVTQPQLLEGLKYESQVENRGKEGSRGAFPNSQH